MLAPHLKAERNDNHDDQVNVREQGNAPDGFGLATCAEGPQEFGEDQHGKSVGAGRFRGCRFEHIEVNRKCHPRCEETGQKHRVEEAAVGNTLRLFTRMACHHVGVDGIGGEAERGQTVGDQINPEQMNRHERCRQSYYHADCHQQQFTGVARQQVLKRFADVGVNAPALFDSSDNRGEVVVGDNHVRRLLGDFRSCFPHGDADVGALDGRSVVDAIAGHRDHRIIRFPGTDDAQFMLGGDAGVNGNFGRSPPEFVVGHLVQIYTGDSHVVG